MKEIADWIINDSTGAPELANDVQELKRQVSGLTNSMTDAQDDINTLESSVRLLNNAALETSDKINALSASVVTNKNDIADLRNSIEDTFEALKEYVDEQIRNISRNGDHVFLSKAEYDELVANGRAVISGETYYYSDYIYYCVYDDGNTYSGASGGSIVYVLSGDMITIESITVDENGMVTLNAEVTDDGFIDLDAASQPITGEITVDDETEMATTNAPVVNVNNEDFIDLSSYNVSLIF